MAILSANLVLILTVGQSLEPLMTSVETHSPNAVILLTSQGSKGTAAELTSMFSDLHIEQISLENPESLSESYEKALSALGMALDMDARSIVVDFTGGTKPMAAGCVLALSGRAVVFSYVGGGIRDAQGKVQPSTSKVVEVEDPTTRFGLREWEAFTRAWNLNHFPDALDSLERILQRQHSKFDRRFYTHLKSVVKALDAWDRFRHQEAVELLNTSLEMALGIAEARHEGARVRVLTELSERVDSLHKLASGKPTFALLADLLANAERRAEAGRFDDALARLYRAIELAVEAELFDSHQIDMNDRSTWPGSLHDLAADTRGLKERLDLASTIYQRFGEKNRLSQRLYGDYHSILKPLLEHRHQSILAHGTQPVSEETYYKLRDYLKGLNLEAAPSWPQW